MNRDDIYAKIGETVAGLKRRRESDDEITVFALTGLAVNDAVVTSLVYRRAQVSISYRPRLRAV